MFCFFKQKTAYEMRISDWSSDVCSSDLVQHVYAHRPAANADQFAGPCIAACRAASGRWQGVILCLEGRRQSRVFRNVGTARSGSTALSTEKIRSQVSMGTRGRFITLEGGEGAGKSTQARFIRDWLPEYGHEVVLTRAPEIGRAYV